MSVEEKLDRLSERLGNIEDAMYEGASLANDQSQALIVLTEKVGKLLKLFAITAKQISEESGQ